MGVLVGFDMGICGEVIDAMRQAGLYHFLLIYTFHETKKNEIRLVIIIFHVYVYLGYNSWNWGSHLAVMVSNVMTEC